MGSDKSLTKLEWEMAQFARLMQGVPRQIPTFSDGVACPWCGLIHQVVTFGSNECLECRRQFIFGFPEWGSVFDWCPDTFVACPHKEFREMGRRGDILPIFEPNERLRRLYKIVDEMRMDAGLDKNDLTAPVRH